MSSQDSVLNTIKKMLGIPADVDAFDIDIVNCINAACMTLNQLGVIPKSVFVSGVETTWGELNSEIDVEQIISYVWIAVRIAFDPPTSSFVLEAMKEQKKELEWRMNLQVERSD